MVVVNEELEKWKRSYYELDEVLKQANIELEVRQEKIDKLALNNNELGIKYDVLNEEFNSLKKSYNDILDSNISDIIKENEELKNKVENGY